MTGPYAKVIADSISPAGHRLTTIEITLHRFVLSEFNTHRTFSRNSASSRAIPLKKQLERIEAEPAFPVRWPEEKPGMQGGADLTGFAASQAISLWQESAMMATRRAELLRQLHVHKSIANRLLEPFMWHTIVVTATAWENFFRQRCSPLAQPEIRVAAELMREAYELSTPRLQGEGSWHLPYVVDDDECLDHLSDMFPPEEQFAAACKVSAARCARVSYLTHDGKRDPQEDLKLYERLVSAEPMHASPLEHVATPADWNAQWLCRTGRNELTATQARPTQPIEQNVVRGPLPVVGNLLGWRQLRLDIELEKGQNSYS